MKLTQSDLPMARLHHPATAEYMTSAFDSHEGEFAQPSPWPCNELHPGLILISTHDCTRHIRMTARHIYIYTCSVQSRAVPSQLTEMRARRDLAGTDREPRQYLQEPQHIGGIHSPHEIRLVDENFKRPNNNNLEVCTYPPPGHSDLPMKPFFDGGGRGILDRDAPIASRQSRLGWAMYTPVVLFPATGPSHCAAPESLLLCGDIAVGPP